MWKTTTGSPLENGCTMSLFADGAPAEITIILLVVILVPGCTSSLRIGRMKSIRANPKTKTERNDTTFLLLSSLQRPNRSFVCSYQECSKRFSSPSNLLTHEKVFPRFLVETPDYFLSLIDHSYYKSNVYSVPSLSTETLQTPNHD